MEVRSDLWRYFLFEDNDPGGQSEILAAISEGLSGSDIETIAITARRQALLNSRDLDLGTISLAVINTRNGRSSLPQRDAL